VNAKTDPDVARRALVRPYARYVGTASLLLDGQRCRPVLIGLSGFGALIAVFGLVATWDVGGAAGLDAGTTIGVVHRVVGLQGASALIAVGVVALPFCMLIGSVARWGLRSSKTFVASRRSHLDTCLAVSLFVLGTVVTTLVVVLGLVADVSGSGPAITGVGGVVVMVASGLELLV
jgi:hypothetical protein